MRESRRRRDNGGNAGGVPSSHPHDHTPPSGCLFSFFQGAQIGGPALPSCRRVRVSYVREIPCACLCPALLREPRPLPLAFAKILQSGWGRVCLRPSPSLGCPYSFFLSLREGLAPHWKRITSPPKQPHAKPTLRHTSKQPHPQPAAPPTPTQPPRNPRNPHASHVVRANGNRRSSDIAEARRPGDGADSSSGRARHPERAT